MQCFSDLTTFGLLAVALTYLKRSKAFPPIGLAPPIVEAFLLH
jgi:hypothetical protein